jgi:hypothetical protein
VPSPQQLTLAVLELSPNLVDGLMDQAAWGAAGRATISIPSANFTPVMSFGNWL